jgi:hypothetical protein
MLNSWSSAYDLDVCQSVELWVETERSVMVGRSMNDTKTSVTENPVCVMVSPLQILYQYSAHVH